MKESREEGLSMHVDAMVGLAGLTSEDFARLMELLVKEELDAEVAVFPLIRWATIDPRAALAFALSKEEFKKTERIIASIVHELARIDLPAAKAALEQMEAEERRYSQQAIVRMMQQKDSVAALAYARELNDPKAESDVLTAWAKTDPLAAAAALPSGAARGEAVEAIATALARRDRAAFEPWAAGLTDPSGRAVARRAALVLDAFTDPRKTAFETAAWLNTEPAAQRAASTLPVHVAQRWWRAKAPSQEVADWALSLPSGPAQDAAVGEVGRLWVEQDPLTASRWIGTLPPSPGRDEAARRLVWKVNKEAPDEAFEWARTIQDSGMRSQMLSESLRTWARKDAEAAHAAVATLPVEHRGNLVELIGKAQPSPK